MSSVSSDIYSDYFNPKESKMSKNFKTATGLIFTTEKADRNNKSHSEAIAKRQLDSIRISKQVYDGPEQGQVARVKPDFKPKMPISATMEGQLDRMENLKKKY